MLTSTDSHQPSNCRSRTVSFPHSRTKWFANCACTPHAVDLPPSLSKFRSSLHQVANLTRVLLVTHGLCKYKSISMIIVRKIYAFPKKAFCRQGTIGISGERWSSAAPVRPATPRLAPKQKRLSYWMKLLYICIVA